jgi:hypothetical protein
MAKPVLNCWEPGYAARYDEPWFRGLPVETQMRFKEQDLARSDAHRRWLNAMTAEERRGAAEAFVALCITQASANLARPVRTPLTRRDPASAMRDKLGVTATERKVPRHEDPAELRRAAIELGLITEEEPAADRNADG